MASTTQQKHSKSSVLKSFIHRRTGSDGTALPSNLSEYVSSRSPTLNQQTTASFPLENRLHARPLGEIQQNQQSQPPPSPKKPKESKRPYLGENSSSKSVHKKTMSSISLKSFTTKDQEKSSPTKSKEPKPGKPKKTKSFTNLAHALTRPKSSKSLRNEDTDLENFGSKDKENRTPPATDSRPSRPPPIYAQFSSEYFTKQPLGGKFLEDEVDRYDLQEDSPTKLQKFVFPGSQTSLLQGENTKSQRPASVYLPSNFSVQDITRRGSGNSARHSIDLAGRDSGDRGRSAEEKETVSSFTKEQSKDEQTSGHRGKRVMAAVAALGSKGKTNIQSGRILEDKDVDRELEAMLDRRNIPEHQRGKMRSLVISIKRDFITQDWAEMAAKGSRPGTNGSDSSADAVNNPETKVPETKSKRPRSRTFNLSRSSSKEPPSPTKKRPDSTFSRHSRTKSTESLTGPSKSLPSNGAATAQSAHGKVKSQLSDDFVAYLRKVKKPELVEVGRLHKLRLLLRNETVAWTDEFIGQGGMEEVVGLLHRIMQVEWREEHEDALLHEVLLCLKALATTELALRHLDTIQVTLFPALIKMLFDEEKKGPSEFTTRNIITSLLFTYLKTAPESERSDRAMTLLSYLRDPVPNESERPVEFILEMRQSRPYQVWCKEVVNVTKEVFWIFLHNLNVIALPDQKTSYHDLNLTQNASTSNSYMAKHFPQELPPVPAAPYVGGVEWDATNYIASHLDLINGIIASLPTSAQRNNLRNQLRVSGWEKCMGGSLRLCKEKFYGGVHAGLRCWVAAAVDDGWQTKDVRNGPSQEQSRSRSPKKKVKSTEEVSAPKLEMKWEFGKDEKKIGSDSNVWL